jgi:serine/threonine protein phosphatase 1
LPTSAPSQSLFFVSIGNPHLKSKLKIIGRWSSFSRYDWYMGRLIAIGDIHGRLSKLEMLMEAVSPAKEDSLVFLGDYIDRGPESFRVVEFIPKMKGEYPGIVTLRGNHEDLVLSFLQGKKDEYLRQIWLEKGGGKHTLWSYSRSGHSLSVHEELFKKLPLSWETDDYFFCHAGVRPGEPLGKQSPVDLLEIREGFIDSTAKFGKIIVHGHTRSVRPVSLRTGSTSTPGQGRIAHWLL